MLSSLVVIFKGMEFQFRGPFREESMIRIHILENYILDIYISVIEVDSCNSPWLSFVPSNNVATKIFGVIIVLVTIHGIGGSPLPLILGIRLPIYIAPGVFIKSCLVPPGVLHPVLGMFQEEILAMSMALSWCSYLSQA